MMTDNDVNN